MLEARNASGANASVETDDARDARRYRYWRDNADWLDGDGDGINGCAFSCQVPLVVIDKASPAELFDIVADICTDRGDLAAEKCKEIATRTAEQAQGGGA